MEDLIANFTGFIEIDFKPYNFTNTYAIRTMHLDTLRGNHTNDISLLFRWSYENITRYTKTNYITGVLISPSLCLSLGLLWLLVLIILKCLSFKWKEELGCSGGSQFRYPLPPVIEDDIEQDGGSNPNSFQKAIQKAMEKSKLHLPSLSSIIRKRHLSNSDEAKEKSSPTETVPGVEQVSKGDATAIKEETAIKTKEEQLGKEKLEQSICSNDESIHFKEEIQIGTSEPVLIEAAVPAGEAPGECKDENETLLMREIYEDAEWRKQVNLVAHRIWRTRLAFLAAGCMAIIASALFIFVAVQYVIKSVNDVRRALSLASNATDEAINITNSFINDTAEVNKFISELTNYTDPLCPPLENLAVTDQGLQVLADIAKNVTRATYRINEVFLNEVSSLQDDLIFTKNMIDSLEEATYQFYWVFLGATVFTSLLIVIICLLMIGVLSAWLQEQRVVFVCARSYFLLPILFIMVFLAWVLCAVFLILGISAGDFCYDSPDRNMELILRNFRENLGSILYSTLLHYINGCSSAWSNPLSGKINVLLSLMIALSAFSENLVEVSADSLQQICGQDQDILFQLVNLVSLTFAQYTSLLVSLRKLFDCSVWSPIYTSIAYDAICYNGTSGLLWGFSTMFTVCLMCLWMVSLRAAWKNVKNADIAGMSPEQILQRNILHRKLEIMWMRFGSLLGHITLCPQICSRWSSHRQG